MSDASDIEDWETFFQRGIDTIAGLRHEVERLSAEGGRKTDLIKLLIKECGEMEFDHTNACMNWAACEHSQIECALCQLRIAVSGTQS